MKNPQNPLNPTGAEQAPQEADALTKANQTLGWLEPLVKNEHFVTFMNTAVAPLLKAAEVDALNVTLPPEDRSNAAFRRDSLKRVFDFPQATLRQCLQITAADAERVKAKKKAPQRPAL